MKIIKYIGLLSCLHTGVMASPWVNPDDMFLRADIQQLADHNVINAPINHWPLSWKDVAANFEQVNTAQLPAEVEDSFQRVLFQYRLAQKEVSPTSIRIFQSTETPKFSRFGDASHEQGGITVSQSFIAGNLAGQGSVSVVQDPQDGKKVRFDGSYMAYRIGNWNITAGAVPMWWGPGWDTALLMSTNARPIPGVSINRSAATPFESPWLSWIGHWSFTSFMGQLEDAGRAVPNARVWSSRLSLRPLPSLELGFSRSTMWAGDGHPSGLSKLWDIMTPSEDDNNANTGEEEDVNDLGSIDFRWNTRALGQPFGLYYEMGFEDYGISTIAPSKRSHLLGIDTDVYLADTLLSVYLEGSDTYHETCACIYEHGEYNSGYRYRGKVIGSTYGSNAQSLTLGVMAQRYKGASWQASLHRIELNKQNENNVNAAAVYEDIIELNGKYSFIWLNSKWDLGSTLRRNKVLGETDNDVEFSFGWQYKF